MPEIKHENFQDLGSKCAVYRPTAIIALPKGSASRKLVSSGQAPLTQEFNVQVVNQDNHEWVRDGDMMSFTSPDGEGNLSFEDAITGPNAPEYYCKFCLARTTRQEWIDAVMREASGVTPPNGA